MARIIQDDMVAALLVYMAARPWKEVEQVMPVLQNLPVYTPPATDKPAAQPEA